MPRGNPFFSAPLWGRAVLCTAGDADCHGPAALAMTVVVGGWSSCFYLLFDGKLHPNHLILAFRR